MNKKMFNVKLIGIVFNPSEKKILIGKNRNDEYCSLVDGELRYDEELDFGLKRVIKDKTGYLVHNLGTIYANNKVNGENTDTLELYFLCELKEGQEKLGENVEEIMWINAEDFEKKTNKKIPKRLKEYLNNICGK